MKDPRNTDTFAHFVHIHDPLAVPPKVTFTTTPAFTESDLLEVARRSATNALVAGRNNAPADREPGGFTRRDLEAVAGDVATWATNWSRDAVEKYAVDMVNHFISTRPPSVPPPAPSGLQEFRDALDRYTTLFHRAASLRTDISSHDVAAARTEVMRLYREREAKP